MKGKARADNSEERSKQESTDRDSEDSFSPDRTICCVTTNKLSNLSEPFLQLEKGADNRDSANFSALSIKQDLSIHPIHSRRICWACAVPGTGLDAWDT